MPIAKHIITNMKLCDIVDIRGFEEFNKIEIVVSD
jgi:hypothetical protein